MSIASSMASARTRSPATALCLVALLVTPLLTAAPPVLAQTAWDRQDQADMLGRLAAQGLVRARDSARARAESRDPLPAPADVRTADRGPAAGNARQARTPVPADAMSPGAEVTTAATPAPARERNARKL